MALVNFGSLVFPRLGLWHCPGSLPDPIETCTVDDLALRTERQRPVCMQNVHTSTTPCTQLHQRLQLQPAWASGRSQLTRSGPTRSVRCLVQERGYAPALA